MNTTFAVLSAKDSEGNQLTLDQMVDDAPELKRKHLAAKKADPTWAMFGGILTVNGHVYQVV